MPSKRNLGLDLMRSLAIVLVLLSHYSNNLLFWLGFKVPQRVFAAGDIGVDLFFVLSGFLIGGLLLDIIDDAPTPRALVIFLMRRWMRTLPLYLLVLAILVILLPAHRTEWATFATMAQNLAWPMPNDGYFFAVSWSLTVEEWFYLAFGCACIIGAIAGAKRSLYLSTAAFLIAPLLLRATIPAYANPASGLYKSVIFRLDCIAYGVAAVAIIRRWPASLGRPWLCLAAGLSLIAAGWAEIIPISWNLNWILRDPIFCVGSALCFPAATRLVSAPKMIAATITELSKQSYALYLLHLPIMVGLVQSWWWQHKISTATAILIAVPAPFILATLSYRFLEEPIMRLRPKQQPSGSGRSYAVTA